METDQCQMKQSTWECESYVMAILVTLHHYGSNGGPEAPYCWTNCHGTVDDVLAVRDDQHGLGLDYQDP